MPRAAELIRQRSALVVRSQLVGRRARDQMAHDFQSLVAAEGSVCNEDLLVIGWTQAQINTHGSHARTRALEASVRCAA